MKKLIVLAALAASGISFPYAADWSDCRAQKREAVRLEQALGNGKKLKGYHSGAAMKQARRNKEAWLRKHCRYYSSRLRDIEREMM